ETIAMESTGVYWIPLFDLLAERGFEVRLVDPRQLKNVPGRKSDVLDCQWIQQLHTFGLLSAAFRPDDQICALRSYLRQRAMLVTYASHHIQHVQKAPTFDVRTHLYRLTGVDLTRIDGIDAHTALKVVAETGLDMSRWPTEKHFASWLSLAPGTKVSGGKKLSGRTTPSANRAAAALRLAARSLYQSKSALGAFFRRLKARLGTPKAITASAHNLARLIYRMLRLGTEYVDQGQD